METGGVPFAFEDLDLENVGVDAEVWEKVVEKMRLGMMPPAGQPRPDGGTYDQFVSRSRRSWTGQRRPARIRAAPPFDA